MLKMTEGTPGAVVKAVEEVRSFHPEVTQVFYGRDNRWLFCDDDFEVPKGWSKQIDQGVLEDAADSVPNLPAAYAVIEE
jgi:hypothetical protein